MYKTTLPQLTRKTFSQLTTNNVVTKASLVRFNSSSSYNNNSKLELDTTGTNTATANKEKQQEAKPDKIPFMPVINIPETEFAHNAFFSLYRPLLGLSDKDEKPFFSNKPQLTEEELEQQKLDDMLANYMTDLQPFTEPSAPGNEPTLKEHEEAYQTSTSEGMEVSIKITEELEELDDMFFQREERQQQEESFVDHFHDTTMPVFHMPESGDVLDFLNTVENKMKKEHAQLNEQESFLRLKKLEMIDNLKRSSQAKPRFSTSPNRNIHQRLRRYQKK